MDVTWGSRHSGSRASAYQSCCESIHTPYGSAVQRFSDLQPGKRSDPQRRSLPSADMTPTPTPVWFVTGCSTGFGHEIARLVLSRGGRVVMTARKPAALPVLAGRHPDTPLAVAMDVTDAASRETAVAVAVVGCRP
jgi:hypothetical protein